MRARARLVAFATTVAASLALIPAAVVAAPAPAPTLECGPWVFPSAETTGVPDGVELTPSGGLTVKKAGTVLDGLRIRGTVTVAADNVTIRNTLIERTEGLYPIKAVGVRNLLVVDSEIDGVAQSTGVGMLGGGFTLRRVDIHDVIDGPRIEGDDVLIEDSYIHDLHRIPDGHHDGVQIRRGTNITLRHNNIDVYHAATGDPMNAAIQIGSLNGPMVNLLVEDNRMNGGNYTVNAAKSGPDRSVYRRNVFGRNYRYGVRTSAPSVVWESTNVFEDTCTPAG